MSRGLEPGRAGDTGVLGDPEPRERELEPVGPEPKDRPRGDRPKRGAPGRQTRKRAAVLEVQQRPEPPDDARDAAAGPEAHERREHGRACSASDHGRVDTPWTPSGTNGRDQQHPDTCDGADPRTAGERHKHGDAREHRRRPPQDRPARRPGCKRQRKRDRQRQHLPDREVVGIPKGAERAVHLEPERTMAKRVQPGKLQQAVHRPERARKRNDLGGTAHACRGVNELHAQEECECVEHVRDESLVAHPVTKDRDGAIRRGDRRDRDPHERSAKRHERAGDPHPATRRERDRPGERTCGQEHEHGEELRDVRVMREQRHAGAARKGRRAHQRHDRQARQEGHPRDPRGAAAGVRSRVSGRVHR